MSRTDDGPQHLELLARITSDPERVARVLYELDRLRRTFDHSAIQLDDDWPWGEYAAAMETLTDLLYPEPERTLP